MRTSRFTKDQKLEILMEHDSGNESVESICAKHEISIATFYSWKRELIRSSKDSIKEHNYSVLKTENHTLRKLYLELSEHNYQLAQFLDK